jgi:tryptophanyl-tRNA synthetase
MGWLSRMTQWKSKLSEEDLASLLTPTANPKQRERMKLGLFSYPVLQAADILIHRATHVPVGEDQLQHIEFARNCAAQFNHTFGSIAGTEEKREILVPPDFVVSPAKRVMSLTEPTKKMSKSHELARSRIMLDDSGEEIGRKLKVALTDSIQGVTYDRDMRPGVSNLIEMIHHMDPNGRTCEEIAEEMKDSSLRVLKEEAARVVSGHLAPMREEYLRLMSEKEDGRLTQIAEEGAEKARVSAEKTMRDVREAVGL